MLPAGAPRPGDVLGSYVLKRLLGQGGMGLVFLAEHEKLKRRVALKLLRPELASDPTAVRRFFAEARAVNEIGHENIVEVTDFVDHGAHLFFVMELLKGHALSDVLLHGRMPISQVVHIARQLAGALAAAHDAGVVHRDLKPQNIFLIRRGSDPSFVKVLDFGIAKMRSLDSGEGASVETATGSFVGTPSYMAPEQLAQKPCDHRVDIYSFGVTLFELATGQRPFRAPSVAEVIVLQLRQPPPKPSELVGDDGIPIPALPAPLEQLILDCLEKDPEKRIGSMRDVEKVLEKLVALAGSTVTGGLKWAEFSGDFAVPSVGGWIVVSASNPALHTDPGQVAPKPITVAGQRLGGPGPNYEDPYDFAAADDIVDLPPSADERPVVMGRPATEAGIAPAPRPGGAEAPPAPAPAPAPELAPAAPTLASDAPSGTPGAPGAMTASAPGAKTSETISLPEPAPERSPFLESSSLSAAPPPRSRTKLALAAAGAVAVVAAVAFAFAGPSSSSSSASGAGADAAVPSTASGAPSGATAPPSSAPSALGDAAAGATVASTGSPGDPVPSSGATAGATAGAPGDATAGASGAATATATAAGTAPGTDPDSGAAQDAAEDGAVATSSAGSANDPDDEGRERSRGGTAGASTAVPVTFTSKPAGATVVIAGTVLGKTPLTRKVIASAKPVPVAFQLEGFGPKTVSTPLKAQGVVSAALEPAPQKKAGPSARDGALINPFKKKPK